MKITDIEELNQIANNVRKDIIEETYNAKSGHPGGSLSVADILTVLYFNQMNVNEKEPNAKTRDRLVLSKGHVAPALYAVLAEKGYFEKDELKKLRKIDGMLQGHPDMQKTPGIDMSTGSLGQGLSVANGMALASKLNHEGVRVYCICGDGEIQEGQIWEAAMTSSHRKLDNLCLIVDNNNLQIDGNVDTVKNIYPLDEKFKSFGFEVIKVDGHDIEKLIKAFDKAKTIKEKPTVIIAKTIKGKGVSFMENKADWHGKAPNKEEYKMAMEELSK